MSDRIEWPFVLDFEEPDFRESMQPPPLLYHYTTVEGFLGIVTARCRLWATDHRYLNDAGEVRIGIGRAIEVLKEGVVGLNTDLALRVASELESRRDKPHYIACFSERHDVLSQWRAYGGNGRGYCLGLRPRERLVSSGDDDDLRADQLLTCDYDTASIKEQLRSRLQRQVDRFRDHVGAKTEEDLIKMLFWTAQRYALMIKHKDFSEERELRLNVEGPNTDIEFRASQAGVIPYRNTQPLSLEEVWIGPKVGPSGKLATESVETLLQKNRINAKVEMWLTSYRP